MVISWRKIQLIDWQHRKLREKRLSIPSITLCSKPKPVEVDLRISIALTRARNANKKYLH
jgi:hypothetical protein